MALTAYPIQSDIDVERLRMIRNATAHGFSNHTDQISADQQRAWWASMQGRVKGWLYRDEYKQLVGFGLLRRDDEGYWLTVVGVLPGYEGRGYGKEITHDIVTRAPGRCKATARKDNPGAVKLHVDADWEIVDGPDERLVYFLGRAEVGEKAVIERCAYPTPPCDGCINGSGCLAEKAEVPS